MTAAKTNCWTLEVLQFWIFVQNGGLKKEWVFLAIPKLLVTFESTFRVLTIDNMLLNQSCITVIAMCSVIDDPPLHKILESIHDSCDLLLDSAILHQTHQVMERFSRLFFSSIYFPLPRCRNKSIFQFATSLWVTQGVVGLLRLDERCQNEATMLLSEAILKGDAKAIEQPMQHFSKSLQKHFSRKHSLKEILKISQVWSASTFPLRICCPAEKARWRENLLVMQLVLASKEVHF